MDFLLTQREREKFFRHGDFYDFRKNNPVIGFAADLHDSHSRCETHMSTFGGGITNDSVYMSKATCNRISRGLTSKQKP